jgi:hypothetical protein
MSNFPKKFVVYVVRHCTLCYNLLGKYQIQSRQKEQFETKLKLL